MKNLLCLKRLTVLLLIFPMLWFGFISSAVAEPGSKILVLYKARDPNHQGLIDIYTGFLQQAGYSYETKDVEKLLIEKPDMSSYHGVMSVFQTSQMVGGDLYPEWLVEQMEAGRRILILGSYGAYQGLISKQDGTFTEWNESTQTINTFFYPFGLQFYFAFTGDNQKLKLNKADQQYAQYQSPIEENQLNSFQLYKSINPENNVFFEVERKDMFDSKSAFNVITPFGGMILEGYSFFWDGEKNVFRVDYPAFMKQVFNAKSPKVPTFKYKTHEELVKAHPLPEREPPVTISEQEMQDEEIPRQVLMLYKKSETKTLGKSLLFNRVAVILEYLGLVPVYRTVEDGLPSKSEMEAIQGIVTWHTTPYMHEAEDYGDWMITQIKRGKKVAILGDYGATYDLITKEKVENQKDVFERLSIEYVDRSERRDEDIPKVRVHDKSMLGFEHELSLSSLSYEDTYRSISPGNRVFFSFNDRDYGHVDLGIITSQGGVSLEETPFYFPAHDSDRIALVEQALQGDVQPEIAEQPTTGAWIINPYRFFSEALGVKDFPAPDVTTLNGSRIFYAHIDGDALGSISLIDGAHFAGTYVYEDILKKYNDIPTSVSVITKNVEKLGNKYFHPGIVLSRKIYQLDNVDVAVHSATHPFDWVGGDPYVINPDSYPYKIGYKKHNLLEEIWGAKLFADQTLTPPNKKTTSLYWSGATNPDEKALEIVWRSGMHNLNGGDPRFDDDHPSLANLASYALAYPPYRQYRTSAQNDYYYTLFLTGDWGGQKQLLQHFEKTEKPHRIYPMNLYYHFYSGIKNESMDALRLIYDYIRTQDSANIFATQYLEITEDYYRTHIGRDEDDENAYWIENNGYLRTLRLRGHKKVDMQRSEGIIGYYQTNSNETYIHMDGRKRKKLYFSDKEPGVPYIIQATQFIDQFSSSVGRVIFNYRGFGKTLIKLGGLQASSEYIVTFFKNKQSVLNATLKTNNRGVLVMRSQLKAPQTNYSVRIIKKG
ncbi:MAG: hypothetical protein KAH20_12035 [Methylococcales bacterium]|nr:hypothetical protein [Methylococcales bacterium]